MLRVTRRGWAAACALLLAISISIACGESLPASTSSDPTFEGGPGADGPEAATSAQTDGGADAALDAKEGGRDGGGCTTDDPYSDAAPLENFEGLGNVTSVRFNRDGGSVYLALDQGGGSWSDLGESEYPLPPSPNPASIRNTSLVEDNPAPVASETTVFWDQPIDGGARRIHSATRDGAGQNLEDMNVNEEPIPRLGKTQALMPWVVGDTEVLYFVLRDAADNTASIHRATRSGPTWNVTTELNEAFDETHPVVTDDERVMYFAKRDSGGRRKIHYVTRPSPGAQWGSAVPMGGDVNWPDSDDQPTWISRDQCTLVFTSNRVGSTFKPYKIVRVVQ